MRGPWVGGFNSPVFSTIKLNNDATEDLYIFDRHQVDDLPADLAAAPRPTAVRGIPAEAKLKGGYTESSLLRLSYALAFGNVGASNGHATEDAEGDLKDAIKRAVDLSIQVGWDIDKATVQKILKAAIEAKEAKTAKK